MLEKLQKAFADSDWDTVDLILLPRDAADAEALLEHIPEEQQQAWQKHMTDEARELLGLNPWDDGSPLCAEVATIPATDIMQMIGVVRALHNPILNHLADKIEAWLRDAVGESIPF